MTSDGVKTWKFCDNLWRVQVFWPGVDVRSGCFFVGADTAIRFEWRKPGYRYRAAGFLVLGFGVGVDWSPETQAHTRRGALHARREG